MEFYVGQMVVLGRKNPKTQLCDCPRLELDAFTSLIRTFSDRVYLQT